LITSAAGYLTIKKSKKQTITTLNLNALFDNIGLHFLLFSIPDYASFTHALQGLSTINMGKLNLKYYGYFYSQISKREIKAQLRLELERCRKKLWFLTQSA